jgi:hypothetical protein
MAPSGYKKLAEYEKGKKIGKNIIVEQIISSRKKYDR